MNMPTTTETIARGGEWLLQSGEPDDDFTPERLTDERRLIVRTAEEFVANDVMPVHDRRTRATKQPDGSFVLNVEKMWITNGGFADLFVVFAKVINDGRGTGAPGLDNGQFTAFLVELGFGVKSGKEEHKMGLHGSSTTALIFQDVRVPAENVLGEVGKGHKGAFNVLNFARFKLGAACGGGAANVIGESAKYAATRRQ